MQTLLLVDIDPIVLADVLAGLTIQHQLRLEPIRSAAADSASTPLLDDATLRTLLTAHGLTARECDLVALDLQGHTRTEIAAICELRAASIKKYWTGINAKLGVPNRQMLRRWILAQFCANLLGTSQPKPTNGAVRHSSRADDTRHDQVQ